MNIEILISLSLSAIALLFIKALGKNPIDYFNRGLALIVFFNITDIITTHFAMACGYPELNPLFNNLFQEFGDAAYLIKLAGMLVILIILGVWKRYRGKYSRLFEPAIMLAVLCGVIYFLIISTGNLINVISC